MSNDLMLRSQRLVPKGWVNRPTQSTASGENLTVPSVGCSPLAEAAQRLADVLTQENDALKRMDFSAAVALVPAKETALAELTKQPRGQTISPPLAMLGQHLGKLATENQLLLERAIAIQTRIVQIVARACVPPPAAVRYGGSGGRAPSNRTAALALSTRA
jgi:hypothetical protein